MSDNPEKTVRTTLKFFKEGEDPLESDALFCHSIDGPAILPKAVIADAHEGHKSAIQWAAVLFLDFVGEHLDFSTLKPQELEVFKWSIQCMTRLAEGEDPNHAFQWSGKSRGRPEPGVIKEFDRWGVCYAVGLLKHTHPDTSLEEIFVAIAEQRNVSTATVEKYWRKYKDQIRERMERQGLFLAREL